MYMVYSVRVATDIILALCVFRPVLPVIHSPIDGYPLSHPFSHPLSHPIIIIDSFHLRHLPRYIATQS